jgi:hypothetical protein
VVREFIRRVARKMAKIAWERMPLWGVIGAVTGMLYLPGLLILGSSGWPGFQESIWELDCPYWVACLIVPGVSVKEVVSYLPWRVGLSWEMGAMALCTVCVLVSAC